MFSLSNDHQTLPLIVTIKSSSFFIIAHKKPSTKRMNDYLNENIKIASGNSYRCYSVSGDSFVWLELNRNNHAPKWWKREWISLRIETEDVEVKEEEETKHTKNKEKKKNIMREVIILRGTI